SFHLCQPKSPFPYRLQRQVAWRCALLLPQLHDAMPPQRVWHHDNIRSTPVLLDRWSLPRSASLTNDLVGLLLFLVGPLEGTRVMPLQPFSQQFPSLLACRHVLDKRCHQLLLPRRESGQRGELVQGFTLRPPWR